MVRRLIWATIFSTMAIFCVVAFTGSQALAYLIDGNWDDWGIEIWDGTLSDPTPSDLIPYEEGGENAEVMSSTVYWPGPDNQDPAQIASVTGLTASIDFDLVCAGSLHSFMEGKISKSLIGLDDNIVNVHWALACGNDGGSAATPEPSTAMMFVVGSFALLGFCRKELFKRKN